MAQSIRCSCTHCIGTLSDYTNGCYTVMHCVIMIELKKSIISYDRILNKPCESKENCMYSKIE